MQNVVKLQFAVFTVFEPFLGWLIATNVKLPSHLRNIIKILGFVNVNFAVFKLGLAHHIIAIYGILRNIIFNSWTFQQMDFTDFSTQFYQFPKTVLIFWIGHSWEVYF